MTPLRTDDRAPLYRRVLGEAWDSLPAPLQTMHDVQSERTADGVAVVERGSGLLARLVAFVIGFPPAGTDIPITVSFRTRQGREYWQRNFAGHAFSSVQEQGRGRFERLLWERFGPLNFVMALVCESERLRFVITAGACAESRCRGRWRRAEIPTSSWRRGVFTFMWRSPTPSPD